MSAPVTTTVDRDDIQGIVGSGYSEQRAARYLMLGIADPVTTRAWLAALAGKLTTMNTRRGPNAINLALTAAGLARLGVAPEVVAMFSAELTEGMATAGRSRGLGDVGPSDPSGWAWGGPGTGPIDLALLLYGTDQPTLEALHRSYSPDLAAAGLTVVATLETSDHGDREPFGFHDGISQPVVDGFSAAAADASTVKAGEFVLGYRNEYGRYTDRPLVPATADPKGMLPGDAARSGRADLGRNGTYLVVRQLQQDVAGFWHFTDQATRSADGTANPTARLKLAAQLVGRWPGGAPLVLAPDGDDAGLATANAFGYFREDPDGVRCPIGAHIRRTNPRDSLDPKPGTQASVDVGKRHRILRRGREYGTRLTPEQAVTAQPGPAQPDSERGLQFMCVNASIGRQFEFLQRTWVNNPKFNGLYADRDPLIGTQPGSTFTAPGRPVRTRVNNLPAFVTVKGGAYFFLPGVRATRYLAEPGP